MLGKPEPGNVYRITTIVFAILFLSTSAEAAVLDSQNIYSSETNTANNTIWLNQYLGSGISGVASSIVVTASPISGSNYTSNGQTGHGYMILEECPDDTYTSCTTIYNSSSTNAIATTTFSRQNFTFEMSETFQASKFYYWQVCLNNTAFPGNCSAVPRLQWFGSSATSSGGDPNRAVSSFSSLLPVKQSYYYIFSEGDTLDDLGSEGTRFISFQPVLGLATPYATSTSFSFGASGYIVDNDIEEDQYLYIRWRNLSNGGLGSGCPVGDEWGEASIDIATTTNEFNVSETMEVNCFGSYGIYYAIKRPGFELFGFTLWDDTVIDATGSFIVGTTTGGYLPTDGDVYMTDLLLQNGFVDQNIPNEANASSTILGLTGFLDLRQQMASKFPINWAIQTVAVIVEASTNYSTSTRPASTTIDFGGMRTMQWYSTTTASELQVTLWSWNWIDTIANIPGWQTIMAIAIGVMYLGMGLFAIREARMMFRELRN